MADELVLRELEEADEVPFKEAVREFAEADPDWPFAFHFDLDGDFAEYVRRLRDQRVGRSLPPGFVSATYLVALVSGRVVGRVSLRHTLNDFLRDFGGHVGFAVVPSARGRGYATEMLRRTVPLARRLGIGRLLVTCDDDNRASATVIERGGGVLEDKRPRQDGGLSRRYWIAVD